MRLLALGTLVAVVFAARAAPADDGTESRARADALVEEGNRLGGSGKLEEAIAKFLAAEAIYPRALHDCNIGLAQMHLERWERAHFYLRRCKSRWSSADGELPEWLGANLDGATARLRAGGYGRVRIATDPTSAQVVVTPFPGAAIGDRELWLAEGEHRITVTSEGHHAKEQTVVVRRGEVQPVSIVLKRVAKVTAEAERPTRPDLSEPSLPAEPDEARPSKTWLVAGIASLAVGAGAVGGGFWFRMKANDAHERLEALNQQAMPDDDVMLPDGYDEDFDRAESDLNRNNALMVTSWVAGGALLGAGTYFLIRALGGDASGEERPTTSIIATPHGARAALSWSF